MLSEQSVCIVGAGPAGLSAYHYLARKGYRDVTIYEAAERVGGKCYTVAHGEHRFDLGAVIATAGYEHVLELAHDYGVDVTACPRHVLFDAAERRRRPLGPGLIEYGAPATYGAGLRALAVAARRRGLAQAGFAELDDEMAMPIAEYIRKHRLSALEHLLVPLFTGYGYGYADEIPMAYLVKMGAVTAPRGPRALRRWLRCKARRGARRWFGDYYAGVMFDGGYQALFDRIAARSRVRLGAPVTRVERGADRVMVTAAGERRAFDRVIFAVEPPVIRAVMDADDRERALLDCVQFVDYWSLLCRVDGLRPRCALFYTDHLSSRSRGRALIASQPHPPQDLCVVYAIGGDGVTASALEANVADDLARADARLRGVVECRRWRYFPHVRPAHMRSFHDGMRRLQGKGRTYFTGEFLNFATVEHACQFSAALVRDHF